MAEWLGIGRQTVYNKMAYYGLSMNGKTKLSDEMEAALEASENGTPPTVEVVESDGETASIESDIPIPASNGR